MDPKLWEYAKTYMQLPAITHRQPPWHVIKGLNRTLIKFSGR
jgi:hypothetical protein